MLLWPASPASFILSQSAEKMFWLLLIWFSRWLLLHQHSFRDKSMCTTDTDSKQPATSNRGKYAKIFVIFQLISEYLEKRPAKTKPNRRPKVEGGWWKSPPTTHPAESHLKSSFKPTKPTDNEQFGKRWSQRKSSEGSSSWCLADVLENIIHILFI